MTSIKTEMLVGSLTLFAIVVMTLVTLKIGDFSFLQKRGYVIYANFRNSAGLDERSTIKIAGVDAGTIDKIELEENMARVTIRINPAVKLYSNARIYINATGLLGDKYIEIRPGNQLPLLEHGSTVTNIIETADIDEIVRNMSDISGKLIEFLADLNKRDLGTALQNTVSNLSDITGDLKTLISSNKELFTRIIKRADTMSAALDELIKLNRDPLTKTMANIETLSASLRNDGPQLIKDIQEAARLISDAFGKAGPEVESIAKNAREALESIKQISDKINKGEGSMGKLVHDDKLYDSISRAAEGLDKSLTSLEKTLSYVDRFKTNVAFRNDYLSKSETNKGGFYLTLQPKKEKYYILGIVKDPLGSVSTKETTVDGTYTREQTIDESVEFTAQFAKRYNNTALRIGLTENTLGLGADQYIAGDRVKLSLDAWDFERNEKSSSDAHVRFGTDFYLFKNLFVSGGMDNMLNTDKSGYFMGGGISFNDDDLKYLFQAVPSVSVK